MISTVAAASFSPSNLVYVLEKNEEACQIITLESDSPRIEVFDFWGENKDVEWEVNNFRTSASVHGLSLNYDEELSTNEREVEVCVSGNKLGEYRGAIILKQAQEGNSVVQLAVWLKVIIEDEIEQDRNSGERASAQQSNSAGSSSSSSNAGNSNGNIQDTQEVQENNFQELGAGNVKENNLEITGSVVEVPEKKSKGVFVAIAVIFLVGVVSMIIYKKNKKPYYVRMQ